MSTLISIETSGRSDLDVLAEALRDAGEDPGPVNQRNAAADLHLDPNLVDYEVWKMVMVVGGGLASGAGKALAAWALEMIRNHRDPEPPVVVKIRGQKLILRTAADRKKLLTTLESLD
jgi:hypothetical protein